jgi:hypothetical protein
MPLNQTALAFYVKTTAAHECGHMTVLYTKQRLKGLNFFPHATAFDGSSGIVETDTPPLGKEDCVALAASIVGEEICLGQYDEKRIQDDRQTAARFTDRPLESFIDEARTIIQKNLAFFSLLHIAVRKRLRRVLAEAYSLPQEKFAGLPDKISVMTLSEVEEVHRKARELTTGSPSVWPS